MRNESRNKLERARPGPTKTAGEKGKGSVFLSSPSQTDGRFDAVPSGSRCTKKRPVIASKNVVLSWERKRVERDEIVSGGGCACAAESKVASWQPPSRSHRRAACQCQSWSLRRISCTVHRLQVGSNAFKCRFRPPSPSQLAPPFVYGTLCHSTLRFPFPSTSALRSGAFPPAARACGRIHVHSRSERWINFLFVPIDERRESVSFRIACFFDRRRADCALLFACSAAFLSILLPGPSYIYAGVQNRRGSRFVSTCVWSLRCPL